MKTPPIQQKQVAGPQNESAGMESEGKSLAPPAFQLKASEANGTPPANQPSGGAGKPLQLKPDGPQGGVDAKQNSTLGTPGVLTITDGKAYLRSGPPAFTSSKTTIPQGTRVEVLEEVKVGSGTYIRVKDHDTGVELGWTSKGNATDLDKRYKNSSPTYTYNVGGFDLLVYLPKDGLKKSAVDVFMFFHGNGGDYKTSMTHAVSKGFDDNPALSGNIADAVSKTGGIAICPQGHHAKMSGEWGGIGEGKFKAMVDVTLAHLTKDLGLGDKPLSAGNVSVAGHSAGGAALGQAALDTGATDVTLQEAGYEFTESWRKLRDWFLQGQAPKTMRVITQGNGNRDYTRTLLKDAKKVKDEWQPAGQFKASEIVAYSKQLVKEKKLAGPVTVQEFQGDGKVEDGGIVLERGYRVLRSDGSLQGSLRLYHLEDSKADHWAASSQTMESSMKAGGVDRAADKAAMDKK